MAILRSIPGLDEPFMVTPLAGGITNRNYRVEAGQDIYVLRVAGENTAPLGIDRLHEYASATAAAALGVGAEVVAYLPEHDAMLTRFLTGLLLSAEYASHGGVLVRAAAALARLHAGPAVPGTFCAHQVIADYHRLATAHKTPLPEQMPAALGELQSLRRIAATDSEPCPCHNDLLPGNLIDDGAAIRIIDWEYAGMGDRFFDLGNLAEHHELTPDAEEQLLAAYFGTLRREDMRKLRAMRRVSALREAMWGYAQAGLSRLDFDFLGYAAHHFQRFWTRRDA